MGLATFITLLAFAHADVESGLQPLVVPGSDAPVGGTPTQRKPPAPKPKKRRGEVSENEGTEAPGRFQAETILKSQYQLHGQPLEVDPD